MPRKRGRGSRAEKYVEKLYRKAGYKTRRNVRSRVGEIDIIARKGNKKLVIEVKSGKQAITSTQIKKLLRKARYYGGIPVMWRSPRSRLTGRAREIARKHRVKVRTY